MYCSRDSSDCPGIYKKNRTHCWFGNVGHPWLELTASMLPD
jgi:hypothetical protein